MTSEEAIQRQQEYLKRRRKALKLGMKKLKRQEEKKEAREQEEIEKRPYNSFDVVEITRRRAKDGDSYDLEAMFL